MSNFDNILEKILAVENIDTNQFFSNNIIFEQLNSIENILPIDPDIIIKAINNNAEYFFDNSSNIINEKQQTYLTQFLEDVEIQTKNFNYQIMYQKDIEKIFLNFPNQDFSKLIPVYIQFFDFSDINEKEKIFKACSNLKNINFALKLNLQQTANGCCVNLRPFGKNVFFLFFNTLSYTRRTIYHEWTHYLQKTCGENFNYIIKNSEQTQKNINIKLKHFNLTKAVVLNYFFKPNEYPTQIDNLIFAIKETWKKYYFHLIKLEFCNLVIDKFKTAEKSILKSELMQQFKNTNKTFEISIKFLIITYICYPNTEYINLIRILREHFS